MSDRTHVPMDRARNLGLTQRIAGLLATGNTVESLARGREGGIIELDEHWVIIQRDRGKGATRFDRGDPLRLEQTGPTSWRVVNIMPAEGEAYYA
jgi:hypothetical protein